MLQILDSFAVNSNMSEDQTIDEAANRTASALHTYAALIVASPIWRKKSLFAMIQLISEKKINTGNLYLLPPTVQNAISNYFIFRFSTKSFIYCRKISRLKRCQRFSRHEFELFN